MRFRVSIQFSLLALGIGACVWASMTAPAVGQTPAPATPAPASSPPPAPPTAPGGGGKLSARTTSRQYYNSLGYDQGNVDCSVRVRLGSYSANEGSRVGLIFWGDNDGEYKDYYLLTINDSAECAIQYVSKYTQYSPFTRRSVEGVAPKPGEWVELRVVIQGDTATAYVNDKQLTVVRGLPERGGRLGSYAAAGDKPVVAEIQKPKFAAPTGAPPTVAADVLLVQDGAKLDPGWPLPNDDFGLADGAVFLKIEPKKFRWLLYDGDVAKAMSITAKMRVKEPVDDPEAGGGLAFWATGYDHCLLFVLESGGQYEFIGVVKGQAKDTAREIPVPPQAKVNLNDWTELNIVATSAGATIKINGVELPKTRSFSMPRNVKFGLVASGGDKATRVEFKDIVVERHADAPVNPRGRGRQ